MEKDIVQLLEMLKKSVSPFHAVQEVEKQLKFDGFKCLSLSETWNLEKGKSYYVKPYDSSLIAWRVGMEFAPNQMLRIGTAHTDWPCLKIKPKPEKGGRYQTCNVEVYGGPILNTWLDRPLSVAGKVTLKSNSIFHPEVRLVDFQNPLFIIPNLAIHMNRKVNEGVELNKQIDMIPLAWTSKEKIKNEEWFLGFLAKELEVNSTDILDYELNLYNLDSCDVIGMNQDMISAPRLDNVSSIQANMIGLLESIRTEGMNLIALFDNEEVGSNTKQGGDSQLLSLVLEKIYLSLGCFREEYLSAVAGGMLLSLDVAHAIHPNHPEKCDITNQIYLNDGVALKLSGNQRYATDCEAIGIVEQICNANDIPYKKFANRSDLPGGATLGTLISSQLPMKTVDMGVPILAMHSARETMGVADQVSLCNVMRAFFSL